MIPWHFSGHPSGVLFCGSRWPCPGPSNKSQAQCFTALSSCVLSSSSFKLCLSHVPFMQDGPGTGQQTFCMVLLKRTFVVGTCQLCPRCYPWSWLGLCRAGLSCGLLNVSKSALQSYFVAARALLLPYLLSPSSNVCAASRNRQDPTQAWGAPPGMQSSDSACIAKHITSRDHTLSTSLRARHSSRRRPWKALGGFGPRLQKNFNG